MLIVAVLINRYFLDLDGHVVVLVLRRESLCHRCRARLSLDNDCCVGTPAQLVRLLQFLVVANRVGEALSLGALGLAVGLLTLGKCFHRVVVLGKLIEELSLIRVDLLLHQMKLKLLVLFVLGHQIVLAALAVMLDLVGPEML